MVHHSYKHIFLSDACQSTTDCTLKLIIIHFEMFYTLTELTANVCFCPLIVSSTATIHVPQPPSLHMCLVAVK